MLKERRLTYLALSAIALMLFVAIPGQNQVMAESIVPAAITDLTGLNVAVYYGTDLSAPRASRLAMIEMYEWMGATVTVLNASHIQEGALDTGDYEILAIPGANPITMNNDLGSAGRDKIRTWVNRGGSYFGICGGAMLAARKVNYGTGDTYYLLNLWNGTVRGPCATGPMTTLNVNTSCSAPDLSGEATTLSSNYQGGGYYDPEEGQNMTVLATYEYNDEPALISFGFGNGSVCFSSTHVETEENSARDGTDYYDDLDDSDSEWDLMKTISIWQVESTVWGALPPSTTTTSSETTTPNTTTTNPAGIDPVLATMIPMIAAASAVVIIVAIVIVKRK
ncbi:MAG: BPL-N domain-containing protein [Candidatus Thorarchaeota archaeon]